jgi:uncharacterized protein
MGIELVLFGGGLAAGLLGAVLGLGGGILIVPFLTIVMGDSITLAIGTSLVAVVASSTGAAAHNVRTGRADVRLGLTLEVATAIGAAAGGVLAGLIAEEVLAGLFAALMAYTALSLLRNALLPAHAEPDATEVDPTAPDGDHAPAYRRHRLPLALAVSASAGVASSLLGVGGGIIKVPLLRLLMGAPMHIAAATSNFMIGVTAAAGAYAYLFRGDIAPVTAGPVVLGAMAGATVGARVSPYLRAAWLTILLAVVTGWASIEMGLRAIGGGR